MQRALDEFVHRRAGNVCEYCRFPLPPFHVEHLIAKKHGGPTVEGNLALACARCNFHKGPNLAGIDAETGNLVRLFHPRNDRWEEHFAWRRATSMGLTSIGRATVAVLVINDPLPTEARERLIIECVLRTQ